MLDQYFNENSTSPLTRLEPVDSVIRIAEDHIGGSTISTAADPVVPDLINTFNPFQDQASSLVPWHLGDMVLYVSQDLDPVNNTFNTTTISVVDPFTGQLETTVGTITTPGGSGGSLHDIILNGLNLMGFTVNPDDTFRSDGNTGHLIGIDSGTAAIVFNNDDGITTWIADPNSTSTPPAAIRANLNGPNGAGVGIEFEAITLAGILGSLSNAYFAVGNRADANQNPNGVQFTTNILYQINSNGVASSFDAPNDRPQPPEYTGPGTQIIERGHLDTTGGGSTITFADVTIVDPNTFIDPVNFPQPDPAVTFFNVRDGLTFAVDNGFGTPRTFEINSGVDIRLLVNPNSATPTIIGDGGFFLLNNDVNPAGGAQPQNIYQFDSGFVLEVGDGGMVRDGDRIAITDSNNLTITFEFNSTGGITPGNVAVPFGVGQNSNTIIASLMNVVNNLAGFSASLTQLPGTNRVTANNANQVTATTMNDGAFVVEALRQEEPSEGSPTPACRSCGCPPVVRWAWAGRVRRSR